MENISLLLFTRLLKLFGDNNFTIKDIYKDVNFYEKNTVYTEDVKENINIALNYLIDNEYILKTNNKSFKINKSIITFSEDTIKYSLKEVYGVFVQTAIFINHNEDSLELKDLIHFFDYFNINYDNYKDSQKLNSLWSLFLQINKKYITENKELFLYKENLYNNYDKYKFNVLLKTDKNKLNQLVNNINDNKELKIRPLLPDKLKEAFKNKKITKISDITKEKLNKIIFDEKDFDEMQKEFKILQYPLNVKLFNDFETYIFGMDERARKVINHRVHNLTLEQIGSEYGVTRERIRQIEAKEIKRFNENYFRKFKKYLSCFADENLVVIKETLKSILNEYTDLFLYLIKNNYDNKRGYLMLELDNAKKIKDLQNTLSEDITTNYIVFNKNKYEKIIKSLYLKYDKTINKTMIHNIFVRKYTFTNGYVIKNDLNLMDKYYFALKESFDTINNRNMDEYKLNYYNIYEEKDIFDRENRSILTRLIDHPNIILLDRGTYGFIPDRFNLIQKDTLNVIYEYIHEKNIVRLNHLYDKFKNILKPYIKNRYELHSILKLTFSDLYFSKDNVGFEINPIFDIDKVLDEYKIENKGVINIDKLMNENKELKGTHISQYLHESEEYISIFNKNYLHVDYIKIDHDELILLEEEVHKLISKYKIINQGQLHQLFKTFAPNMVFKNKINNNVMAYNLFNEITNESFVFTYPNLTYSKFNSENMDIKLVDDILINKFKDNTMIKINDIFKEARLMSHRINNMKNLLERFYDIGFVRHNNILIKLEKITNSNFRNSFNIKFQKYIRYEMIPFIKNDGYMIINDNYNFKYLPPLSEKFPWDKHFLAHLLIHFGNDIMVETKGSQYTNLYYEVKLKNDEWKKVAFPT